MLFSLRKTSPLMGACLATVLALATGSAQARTLDTAHGEVEVDGQPSRVVTLYEGALDAALAAGVTPLAAVATRGGQGVAGYLSDRVPDIAMVGTSRELNLEAIAAQNPDLILASPYLSDEQYALVSQLAPTVVPESEGFTPNGWKNEARLYGEALGHAEEVEEAIEAVETRAADLAERLDSQGTTTSLVRWMPQGPLVMSTELFSTGLLEATGFDVTDADLVKEGRPHSDPLSLENLGEVDTDLLFMATLNEDGREALDAARQSPAFSRLEVAKRDQVIPVDGQLWTSASGPLAAQAVLDDIETALSSDER
ncbi:ABC transporter substrate-binding protein [Halomonas caseinilytica]|uniref:Iron complex transport system substrate-binding protein n=1 Tax=Halomonas caseinilytica TaxID=438744 RepID=A0A1M6MGH5_9GAMM|nr:ABC transporter substrate-binding protein [Halomonas caseinilytica]SEM39615.1 iron complex transport system substrate-binding protein [Halomonas caseinilytica]SHJ82565.1 iron complex transport system substrate-binding protein [Halomonas caseinilytica]